MSRLMRDLSPGTYVLNPGTAAVAENIEAFRDWAASLPELIGVYVVSGEQDFLLHVGVRDTDALYAFVIDRLTERAEVADVNTSVVYEHIRRTVLEPLNDQRR